MTMISAAERPAAASAALERWREAVGAEHVLTQPARIEPLATATFHTEQEIPAVVRPGSVSEVQAVVRIAHETRTPIYPISTGKNWGSGSAVPYRDGSVLVDLGRLTSIREIDDRHAFATVEAGVTQEQLQSELQSRGAKHFLPTTSSSPATSIVGNIVERGQARGPVYERFATVCALEVVLPTGELVHTGFEGFPGARTGPLHRFGVGPYVDGLFTQSGFGIVTAMSVALEPVPKCFQTCFFKMKDDSRMAEIIDAIRDLLQGSSMKAVFSISSPMGILSYLHQYPWEAAGGERPLPEEQLHALMIESKVAPWNGLGMVYSESDGIGREQMKLMREALKEKVDFFTHVNRRIANFYRALRRPWKWVTKIDIMEFLDFAFFKSPNLGNLDGKGAIPMAYWRKRSPVPEEGNLDPDRDRCGFISTVIILPYEGKDVVAAFRLIEEEVTAAGFEPNFAVRCGTDRNVEITSFLIYDRETEGDDERAMACHRRLLARLMERGYLPSRLGLQSVGLMPPPEPGRRELHRRLKEALDPHGILAPGRYDFSDPSFFRAPGEGEAEAETGSGREEDGR